MVITGVGRLGNDAELRYTPGGDSVVNLSIAFNWGKKDASGKRQTTWLSATLWGKLAEALADYLVKGQQVSVVCDNVRIETFEKRDHTIGHSLKADVRIIELVGSRPRDEAEDPEETKRPATPSTPPAEGKSKFDDFEDDLPF